MSEEFYNRSLDYHSRDKPGKISISCHKELNSRQDLSLAYSPGVAAPVQEISKDPSLINKYTARGNLVAVISDGSAVLGLGNVGSLAAKPVMEGKAVLFKKFANIDAIDIELATQDVDKIVDTIINIAPTFAGINLEDISAPRCFEIEKRLIKALDIPVFHDDQHGTAIITAAGLLNALEIQEKNLADIKLVCVGAGSAGIAILNLLFHLGLKKENSILVDSTGVVSKSRSDLNDIKLPFAIDTDKKTLEDAMKGADVFVGVARADLLSVAMLKSMAKNPIVFAMSNPDPEINVEVAKKCRSDLIIGTGRSDFSNQINNVLGFPYIFRGALDAHAVDINIEMKIAAVNSLKDLAKLEVPNSVLNAYNIEKLSFGKDYIIPKPFDPRLIEVLPEAIFNAAIASGASLLK